MSFDIVLSKVVQGEGLSVDESREAFDRLFTGEVLAEKIATFLLGLAKKGETADELLGAVLSMRAKVVTIEAPPDAMDIVGTGGDQSSHLLSRLADGGLAAHAIAAVPRYLVGRVYVAVELVPEAEGTEVAVGQLPNIAVTRRGQHVD